MDRITEGEGPLTVTETGSDDGESEKSACCVVCSRRGRCLGSRVQEYGTLTYVLC